jgi:hypothetical protein
MNAPLTDVTRCRPIIVDHYCRNCSRWADHPEQTHFNVTRSVNTLSSRDEACAYVPINPQKGTKA